VVLIEPALVNWKKVYWICTSISQMNNPKSIRLSAVSYLMLQMSQAWLLLTESQRRITTKVLYLPGVSTQQ